MDYIQKALNKSKTIIDFSQLEPWKDILKEQYYLISEY